MNLVKHVVAVLGLVLAAAVWAGEPVDVNSASAEALAAAIPGVGLKKAQAIVAYRAEHGPFHSLDDLTRVSGIGPHTVERGRANLTVGKAAE